MCNQTPRHSGTKHINKQDTINSKVEHWDYTTWGLIWDVKKRKERTIRSQKEENETQESQIFLKVSKVKGKILQS